MQRDPPAQEITGTLVDPPNAGMGECTGEQENRVGKQDDGTLFSWHTAYDDMNRRALSVDMMLPPWMDSQCLPA